MTFLNEKYRTIQMECEKKDCLVIGEFVVDCLTSTGSNFYLINMHLSCIIIFSTSFKIFCHAYKILIYPLHISMLLVTLATKLWHTLSIKFNIYKYMYN